MFSVSGCVCLGVFGRAPCVFVGVWVFACVRLFVCRGASVFLVSGRLCIGDSMPTVSV